ncbi:MAG: hypothetical protein A2358_03970 [Candidatus Staskawiczbacteria bacterium RIFOXYB1_FULL_37_44]|uniref:DUF5666 domain-containing protein n=1 Tax=Candidatus Staskawiczbacteria bacterium RIFOXYB1_FULL_37_44 TaxID=1802223 RepID=A0A1G2IWN2_9BACT|nr:MAG: hypothetical protein A2358_03970 [Candidatus Staskawiczbacteria bacterium RIFOXYB1_FULL_37_44]OGZ83788.1 MAG: hypothetical protein A2416_00205 [Candidatus Staskawiczbacteria bacterium RIFOXYC1_FULL_37_52]OGZ88937.1 MAG: hypothetical protein A2581_01695 [Candidatus Staskawiczbacteria bacterium RIFOXYD1_FULL_37_110]
MNTNNILESKLFKAIILSIAVLIILVFVFGLGVFVGTKKADFSFRWADQYHRNFGGPQRGFFGDIMGNQFTNSNGVFGQILKIDGQILIIKGRGNAEKSILVSDKTSIIRQRDNIKLFDLKTDDIVVVIGEPNDNGQIEAKLIRVLPPPPMTLRPDTHKFHKF